MNIVKISTTGTEGRFTNRLSEAIHINPYSKIGLQNIVAYPHAGIDIDSTNDTFTYRTAASYGFNTVTLTHGNYTISTLLIEIQRAMNASLIFEKPGRLNQTNFQWKTIFKKLKLHIQAIHNTARILGSQFIPVSVEDMSNVEPFKGTGTNNYSNWVYGKIPFGKGAGYCRFTVNDPADVWAD